MNNAELMDIFLKTIPLAFFDLLGGAAMGGVIVAFLCECAAALKKKAFLDKFAQQLTVMSLWALLLATGAGVAAYFTGAGKIPGLQEWLLANTSPALPLLATLGFSIFALSLYKSTWRNLRQKKGPHLYLGALAAIGALLSIAAIIGSATAFSARFLTETGASLTILDVYTPGASAPLWPLTLGAVFLCLTYGGGMGMAYLVHRRNRDDFGRDYYNYALPLAAKWAIVPLVGVAIAGIWLAQLISKDIGLLLTHYPLVCYAGTGAGLLLLAICVWLPLAVSKQPLQLKGLALLTPLLLWAIHALLLFGALIIYPLT